MHIFKYLLIYSPAALTRLIAKAPYAEEVVVHYEAAAALGGPHSINTAVVDFGLRSTSLDRF